MKSQFLKAGSNFVRILDEPNYTFAVWLWAPFCGGSQTRVKDWLTGSGDALGVSGKNVQLHPHGTEGQA